MRKKKVLIIDDEKGFTDLVRDILEQTGLYQVISENDPSRCVAAVNTFKPDLILLDVVMPGLDGAEVANLIRKEKYGKRTPIVFVSVLFNQRQQRITGTDKLLSKPIHIKELMNCVEKNLC